LKIISLNLNGIRSAANKGVFSWLKTQQADIICMQEIKAQAADLSPEMLNHAGYFGYFHYAEKKVTAALAFIVRLNQIKSLKAWATLSLVISQIT